MWGGSADIAWGWCNICTGVVQILHPYNKFIIKYILKEKKYSKEKKGQAWGLPLSLLLGVRFIFFKALRADEALTLQASFRARVCAQVPGVSSH